MSDSAPDHSDTGDVRKALQHAVCQIIWEQDRQDGTMTTPSAIAALTELTFQYATKSLIPDLYAFSTHANRKSTISCDDVALALRKLGPDRLKDFKRDFCSGSGSKTTSTKGNNNFCVAVRNRKQYKMGKSAAASGPRRKSNQADIQSLGSTSHSSSSLSLSSSSPDEDDYGDSRGKKDNRKQEPVGASIGGNSSARRSRITASSHTASDRPSRLRNQSESLLNKFQIPLSRRSGRRITNGNFGNDSSSTEDDIDRSYLKRPRTNPKLMSPARGEATAQSCASPTLSLQRFKSKRHHSKGGSKGGSREQLLLRNDETDPIACDDSSLDEDITGNQRAIVRYSRRTEDGDAARNHEGSKPQSQVAEALANLSSDSGMEGSGSDNETDDEILFEVGKNASSSGHRPVIESDDED
mmetsp:Transcript_15011/g.34645  ORF Transcript_15011/g.34645 Transcript_15011/m.34645 type:complete len:412 (-) Transcript_15011:1753-2988(-)